LLDLAALAVGLDYADVLVAGALGGRDFDRADIDAVSITTACPVAKRINEEI
jgi:hypothetical protein